VIVSGVVTKVRCTDPSSLQQSLNWHHEVVKTWNKSATGSRTGSMLMKNKRATGEKATDLKELYVLSVADLTQSQHELKIATFT